MITIDQNSEEFAEDFRSLIGANIFMLQAGIDPEDPVFDMTVLAFFDKFAVGVPEEVFPQEEHHIVPEFIDNEAPEKPAPVENLPEHACMGYVITHKESETTAKRFETNLFQTLSAAHGMLDTVGTKEAQNVYQIIPVFS